MYCHHTFVSSKGCVTIVIFVFYAVSLVNAKRSVLGLPTVGFINPTLYANANLFNDIVTGNSSCCAQSSVSLPPVHCVAGFTATEGWDPVTGLGSISLHSLMQMIVPSPTNRSSTDSLSILTPPSLPSSQSPVHSVSSKETSAGYGTSNQTLRSSVSLKPSAGSSFESSRTSTCMYLCLCELRFLRLNLPRVLEHVHSPLPRGDPHFVRSQTT